MPTALRKRTITAPLTPDATEIVRGSVSLVPRTKLAVLLDALRDTSIAEAQQTNEAVTLAMLGEAIEYLLGQPMAIGAKWDFRAGMKPGPQPNSFLKTNGLGEMTGILAISVRDIEDAAVDIPELRQRGTFTFTAPGAAFPTALAANAIGATQTGNGRGAGNAILSGDAWFAPVSGSIAIGIAADVEEIMAESYLVALFDNPGQDPAAWAILEKEEVSDTSGGDGLTETFYRAINFNGPSITTGGKLYEGHVKFDVEAPNMNRQFFEGANSETSWNPPLTGDELALRQTVAYNLGNTDGLPLRMSAVPPGRYRVKACSIHGFNGTSRNLSVGGSTTPVLRAIVPDDNNSWHWKLTAFDVDVLADGFLDIRDPAAIGATDGQLNLAFIETFLLT